MTFAGFPSRAQATAIPNVFFSDVLPALAGDPAAVGVALYAFDALLRKRGFPRYLTVAELEAEPALARFLRNAGAIPGEESARPAIERGLATCVRAGVLLALERDDAGLYFLNTPTDRRGMAALRAEGATAPRIVPFPASGGSRSAIFALYEQEIGTLTPQIIEQLAEAERLYPAEWLPRAFAEAAAHNARAWRYVERILERWATEGPDPRAAAGDQPPSGERYFRGKYGRILRQRDGT